MNWVELRGKWEGAGGGFPPAAVCVAAQQNLAAAAAHGAVGLVAVVIVHIGHLQVDILRGGAQTIQSSVIIISSKSATLLEKIIGYLDIW